MLITIDHINFDYDSIPEFIIHYEANLTNYYRLFKADSNLIYKNITTSYQYWY